MKLFKEILKTDHQTIRKHNVFENMPGAGGFRSILVHQTREIHAFSERATSKTVELFVRPRNITGTSMSFLNGRLSVRKP